MWTVIIRTKRKQIQNTCGSPGRCVSSDARKDANSEEDQWWIAEFERGFGGMSLMDERFEELDALLISHDPPEEKGDDYELSDITWPCRVEGPLRLIRKFTMENLKQRGAFQRTSKGSCGGAATS